MASHLRLTAANMRSSYWLSAGMLLKDPLQAQLNGRKFQQHLLTIGNAAAPYDNEWLKDDTMMNELGIFCDLPVPCCLWHGGWSF